MKKIIVSFLFLYFTIGLFAQKTQRTVLYEQFTSSTCPPCATFNTSYFNDNFLNANEGSFTLIKYQMNWPSPGDPYYTEQGGVRKSFYSVNSVPTLFIDAQEGTHFSITDLQNDLDAALAVPANHEISGTFQISENFLNFQSEIISAETRADINLFYVIAEKTTTGNIMNNGESSFTNVMMWMYPNADGVNTSLTEGGSFYLGANVDLSSTNVEEMQDLALIIFIQDLSTGEVLQSAYATEGTLPDPAASTAPANGGTEGSVDLPFLLTFNQPLIKADGSEITNTDLPDIISVSTPTKEPVNVSMEINNDKNIISISPVDTDFWTELTEYTITLADNVLKNESDNMLPGFSSTFTTQSYPQQNLVFTPVNGATNISAGISMLSITFEQTIRQPDGTPYTSSNISDALFIEDTDGNQLSFTANITLDQKTINIIPSSNLPYASQITFGTIQDMISNKYGVLMDAISATFTTENNPAGLAVFDESLFKLYPNPATESITAEIPSSFKNNKLTVTDITGRIVLIKSLNMNNKEVFIDTKNLEPGIYFCSFISDNNIQITKRFAVSK